jgi:hypothetical protein
MVLHLHFMRRTVLLTKSLLTQGIQCPKQLFLKLNRPELDVEEKPSHFQTMGNELGELARTLYQGVLVTEKDPQKAVLQTQNYLKENGTLFEAAFQFEDLFFRADVLTQSSTGISLVEFKASTELKDEHKKDLAIQAYILQKLKIKVESLKIGFINKKYTKDLPLKELFIIEDVTTEIESLLPWVAGEIKKIKGFLHSKEEPDIDIGPHCTKPFECPYRDYCHKQKKVPEISVLNFPHFNKKWDFYKAGKIAISQLSERDFNTVGQKKRLQKLKSKEPYLEKPMIQGVLSSWNFPIGFLDFETISFGYPIFDKLRPFQEIPFQYSYFVIEKEGKSAVHKESYLAPNLKVDPRIQLSKNLISLLGKSGSIVSYNASFEKRVILDLAEMFPQYSEQLLAINERIVDLLPVMRDYVYYEGFKLSWSIKSVIPAIFGKSESYENLKISNGLEAQSAYLQAIKNGTLEKIKEDLKKYCDKDVLEMVRLFNFLKKM